MKENFIKIDFKILRVDILSKFFLKITLKEILNFFMLVFPYYTRFLITKQIFLEIFKVDNLFIREITNDFKMLLFILKN